MVVAITAKKTCLAPRSAATSGGSPSSIRRWIFSTTTMASSTTRPMAKTKASRVKRLIEKPSGARMMKVERIQIGATTEGIRAARHVPRNRKFTAATRPKEMPIVHQTSRMASLVKVELSEVTISSMPGGRVWLIAASSLVTALEISKSLA